MSEHDPVPATAGSGGVDVERDHNFDGITEFDNRLPNWWLWTFYGACIFSVFYWLTYHTFGFAALPTAAYQQEIAEVAAAEEAAFTLDVVTDDALRGLLENDDVLSRGESLFQQHCVACHKADGSGIVGPNLTDKFWLHGGAPTAIYKTVTEGVPEKGMIPWEPVLGVGKCQQVVAYVLTMRNKNLPGKEPQGDEYSGD